MSTLAIVLLGIAAWCLFAFLVALVVGRVLRKNVSEDPHSEFWLQDEDDLFIWPRRDAA